MRWCQLARKGGMCRSWGTGGQEEAEAAHRRQPCAVVRASNNEDGPGTYSWRQETNWRDRIMLVQKGRPDGTSMMIMLVMGEEEVEDDDDDDDDDDDKSRSKIGRPEGAK